MTHAAKPAVLKKMNAVVSTGLALGIVSVGLITEVSIAWAFVWQPILLLAVLGAKLYIDDQVDCRDARQTSDSAARIHYFPERCHGRRTKDVDDIAA